MTYIYTQIRTADHHVRSGRLLPGGKSVLGRSESIAVVSIGRVIPGQLFGKFLDLRMFCRTVIRE